jgi:hypothetical protein
VSLRADRRTAIFLAAFLLLVCQAGAQSPPQPQAPAETAFDDRAASALLRRLGEALEGHSRKKLLALFDLPRMKDGPLFQQQISLLLAQTESIRVHLNLVEAAADNRMSVDAEMELQPVNGGPASRRNERLAFTVVPAGKGWKFVDVRPRSFFALP